MMWLLITLSCLVAWLLVASFFIALCYAAGQADEPAGAEEVAEVKVVDLGTFRERPECRPRRRGETYFKSRESRRSLSSLPSV
jgi:hypothetical protein